MMPVRPGRGDNVDFDMSYLSGVSSKLGHDDRGRLIVIITSPSPGLAVGDQFLVLGNLLRLTLVGDEKSIAWLGVRTGRPADARERSERRPRSRRQQPIEVADEFLEREVAIEAARREQQAAPADLISAVLPA
jgi:hypothetical protein